MRGSATFTDANAAASLVGALIDTSPAGVGASVTVTAVNTATSPPTVTMSAAFAGTTGSYTVNFARPDLNVLAGTITYPTTSCGGTASIRTPNQVGSTGAAGAIREFTRFLCRGTTDFQGTDPFTGQNYGTEITNALVASGFQLVPHRGTAGSARNLVSPGSNCAVYSQG
jgi:hypothetical protein